MPLRILVVERDVHAREGLRAILSSAGYAVSIADDLWAGFARVSSQTFDLLLLDDDVQPETRFTPSVLDLLRYARRHHAATVGIVISSFPEDEPRYVEPGVLAVLEKPVEVPRLHAYLEALMPQPVRRIGT